MTPAKPGIEVTDPPAYRNKLFDLLGDRDPLDAMSETPKTFAETINTHSAKRMRTRPFPGKWTPNEIVGHLADAEYAFGYRMRLILSEDQPTLLGMDQNLWVIAQRHNEREPSDLLEMFTGLRLFNLALWRQMTRDDLERTGLHNERGPESLGTMLRMVAGHDLWHVDQISRYLNDIAAAI